MNTNILKIILIGSSLLLLASCGTSNKQSNNLLKVDLGKDLNITLDNNITIKATILSTNDIRTYVWKEGNIILSEEKNLLTNNFTLGEHNVTLTVTDNKGNNAKDTIVFTIGQYIMSSYTFFNSSMTFPQNIRYKYDKKGNLLELTTDTTNDGIANLIQTNTFDKNNNLLERSYYDNENDFIKKVEYYTYFNNNLFSNRNDTNGDGSIDNIHSYGYDENHNLIVHSYDKDNDGDTDINKIYTYDDQDNMLRQTIDKNGDLKIDEEIRYNNDPEGNHKQTIRQIFEEGVLSHNYMESKFYHLGQIIQIDLIEGTIGNLQESSFTFKYDDNRNLISVVYDKNTNDNHKDKKISHTYDNKGNQISTTIDNNLDGTIDEISTYSYDKLGQIVNINKDSNADGTVNEVTVHTYDVHRNLLSIHKTVDGEEQSYSKTTWTFITSKIK